MKERELFLAALDIEDRAARQAHLKVECAGDAELLARVESLLASHEGQSQFLNTPVVEQIADVSESVACATIAYENGSTHDDDPDATTLYSNGTAPMTKQNDDAEFETALGYLEPSSKPDSLGRLGHYEVLEVIGRGAFGTVLRAFDESLHRIVAIKVMSPEMAATSPARKRFLREAQSSAAIRHEHVVSVYAVEEKPLPYLVMEFIPGETLQQRLDARGPLDVPTVLHLGRQIAEGLAAAHAQELIHRDIKPGNILLETSVHDRVKITDFGLARAADDASLTQSGTIAGTPMYMAPEQAMGNKIDQRADLFSFGSVLYQMVSGRPPFRAATTLAVLKRLAEDTPRPICEIIPETPQWLCDIISKLHAKNPDDRYQSARDVADVLADCEAQLKSSSRLKDYSRIPRPQTQPPSHRRALLAATALFLLPLIALAVTEFAGLTHLFRGQRPGVAATPEGDASADRPVDPKPGNFALLFDGRTSYIEVPTLKRNDPGPYTIECRVRLTEVRGVIISMEGSAACQIQPQRRDNPYFSALERSNQGNQPVDHGADVMLDEWYHLAYVLGSSECLLFLNGRLSGRAPRVAADQVAEHPSVNRSDTLFGSQKYAEAKSFHSISGSLDEVRISKIARYDKDFTPQPRFEPDGDTVALYHFDEGTGDELKDSSGNNHHGKIFGAKWVKVDAPLAVEDPGWVQLFNRTDLTGWKTHPDLPGHFEVKEGILIGSQRRTFLFTERGDYENFHLRAEAKINLGGDSGIFFRSGFGIRKGAEFWQLAPAGGFEAQIHKNLNVPFLTGSVSQVGNYAPPIQLGRASDDSLIRPDEWFTIEIIANQNRIITKVNGKEAVSCSSSSPENSTGHIALQVWDANTAIQFRKIEIKELPSPSPPLPPTFKNSIGMEFVIVPKGKSWLGGGKDVLGDREVEIPADFFLGKYEVTQDEWTQVMGENPSHFSRTGAGKDAVMEISDADLKRFPVETVSWDDCQLFVAKLNEREKESGWVYRLPTATEWEYACRGGPMTDKANSGFDFYFAKPTNNPLREQSSFGKNMGLNRTGKVGSHESNGLGIFDMHRNVWEWCDDMKEAADGKIQRVQMGGGWNHIRSRSAAANIESQLPSHRSNALGLRLARVPSPEVNSPEQ